jgi:uncharacterized protein (TIGR03437 family)
VLPWIFFWLAFCCGERFAPQYSAATVVHAATALPVLAPNTFASIYGKELAYTTRALASADLDGGQLPTVLPGTGVRVLVDGLAAPVWYVSPTQINFLVPGILQNKPSVKVLVSLDGKVGPEVECRLVPLAPGLFALDPETVIATRLDGALIRDSSPAAPGMDIVLYATGLGPTIPDTPYRQVARGAAPLLLRPEFQVLLNGAPVPDQRIRYAGAAPQFAGLYQINLWLPENTPANPQIQLRISGAMSPSGLHLPLR